MARKIPIYTEGVFHVFNRGVDKRNIFGDDRDHRRLFETISYYRFEQPIRLAQSIALSSNKPSAPTLNELSSLEHGRKKRKLVEVISYCLMPNHFHLILKQLVDGGITEFMHRLGTSYTNFFNTKYQRSGSLFQGTFKAVLVETEEQLVHLSRYIHLNPLKSSHSNLTPKLLSSYHWSSFPEYLGKIKCGICDKDVIFSLFKNSKDYESFVLAKINEDETEKIKGLDLDNDFGWYNNPQRAKLVR
jgi:putative transposase